MTSGSVTNGQDSRFDELLAFFKALPDANRLKIVAILAREDRSVDQLAADLGVDPSTVSHHLSRLARTGLVSARAEGYYSVYRLQLGMLSQMAERLLSQETLPPPPADVDLDAYDRKVLSTRIDAEGKIRDFPVQRKKEEAILRHVSRAFEPGRRYAEKEVNSILARFHDDTARSRRNLVDFGLMKRQGGGREYWRVKT